MNALHGRSSAIAPLDAEVIIVGSGFGGIGMAIQLERAGKPSFLILERANAVGGTWRDNTYPGCACDIPAMLYSFSFESQVDWTRTYPQQAEILDYLVRTSKKAGVYERIRFDSNVCEARFDEASATWTVTLSDGTVLRSRVVICAMGPLTKPRFPNVPGRETFAGSSFHSSAWDHSIDLRAKNVVVIGTGASAIQFVPQIAPTVGRLTLFQRTAPWVIPRNDRPVGKARTLARRLVPMYAWLVRKAIYWMLEIRALGFVVNPKLLERQETSIRSFITHAVTDPVLRAKVTPAYRAGCKRILISDDYYPALQRPNVELVTDAIAEIRPQGVVMRDGREIAADVIVYGTGFNATDGIVPVRVYGRDAVELGHAWRDGMQAYLGTSVAGFPNFFLVIGPNTGLGHNSMIYMMEAQFRYILGALEYLERTHTRAVDVKPKVMESFNEALQNRMQGTVWATGCSSWYQNARGKNVSLWPGFTFNFRRRTSRFDATRYRRS